MSNGDDPCKVIMSGRWSEPRQVSEGCQVVEIARPADDRDRSMAYSQCSGLSGMRVIEPSLRRLSGDSVIHI